MLYGTVLGQVKTTYIQMWGLSCGYRVRFDNSDAIVRFRAGLLFTKQLPNNIRIASRMSGE
jgi:hypothetical protein